ncbi:hypothetical protein [Paraflavitalea sp. CAU 1676]|uniref:hypothetical protein n=1 Tax=Paraflavitalea sp. CAU 1676 TaxID=3032598 RepID=UPI0023DB98A0|nr:hypothetical protein [Paraflavitalea sp. CAU 1676]MDF2191900.1 hypothetical protein [Paraflavitalea sp. CAU 1676]
MSLPILLQPAFAQAPRTGQPLSNLRKKTVYAHQTFVQLDSLSIIPKTLSIPGVPDSLYTIDYVKAALTWKAKPALDTLVVYYRVFPRRLDAVLNRMPYDSIMNNFIGQPFVPNYAGVSQSEGFFNFGNINYNGSFGRAISFGNSQDAVVTSNLNLQLNGFLADSIEIVAAITDNNIPIQPDGTTQELNEFDRIFLQFKKKNWALSLGDIDIRQSQSYFLNFYKRLQGISFETTSAISPTISNNLLVSGSIAKGKFTRNVFNGQEGNQGPYRLQGANSEFFFVVLANTERVFIDGELLQRGEDQDYVINYNTAEITFTPKRMITKDRRIQVEFEYADRNYLNSNIYLTDEVKFGQKATLRVGFFNNADAKSSPINQSLDPRQKLFLNGIGDSINRAFYPTAAIDTFAAGKILYKKIDTTWTGAPARDSIYVYSTHPDSARYSLSFIDVGPGNGNYLPDLNGANGKVYRWVEPVDGKAQGQYEPAVLLVTPKKQQLVSLGIDYNITKNTVVNTEVAMSNYDVNTFSSIDKGNDKGYAGKIQLKNTLPFKSSRAGLQLITEGGLEYVEAKFKPLERLRNVEFTRDWGLPLQVTPEDEAIVTGGTQLQDARGTSLKYQFTRYTRGSSFTGIRNTISHFQNIKGWKLNNVFMYSNMNATNDKGFFFRPTIDISRQFPALKNYTLGFNYSIEHNEVRNKLTDTVAVQSFSFENFQASIKSDVAKPNRWGVIYFTRTNAYPLGRELATSDRSHNINVFTELLKNERHQFRFNGTYRTLTILNEKVTTQKADNSLLGRAEYLVNEWGGLVTGNVLYEVGAGQEQKRDFAYLEVPAGQGEFTWIDYNNDGVQQLNEFEVALFQDQAKYIRIFTPTNQFVKANYNTFNYTVGLNPRSVINMSAAKKFMKLLANVNLQSSLQLNKKELAKGLVQFNPFKSPLNDTSLITLNSIFINTFSYNRFSPKWGLDINNSRNSNKSLLTYGYESRNVDEWNLRGRWNITRLFMLELSGKSGINELASSNPKFDNRNYKIDLYAIEPRLTFTKGANFRAMVGYKFTNKENQIGGLEHSESNAISSEVKYNILQSTSILGRFTYNNITYSTQDPSANTSSPAAYIILDGLLPGKNYLWNLDLTKRLSNSLEINIQYEGRKPGTSRVVHIGRAAIRALL